MFLTSVILELVRRLQGSFHFTLLLSGLALCLMDPRWLTSCLPGIMSSFQKKRKWKKKNEAVSVQKSKSFPKSSQRAATGKYNQNMSILQLPLFLTLKLCITRRKWQPTPVFLPGESQGRGSLLGCRLWGITESDTTEATQQVSEGNGNPLQCSCLENPRDGGAWWAAVYGVTESRTRLKRLSSSSKFQQVVSKSLKTGFSSGSVFHSICDFTQICKSFWTFISSF